MKTMEIKGWRAISKPNFTKSFREPDMSYNIHVGELEIGECFRVFEEIHIILQKANKFIVFKSARQDHWWHLDNDTNVERATLAEFMFADGM